MIPVSVAPHDRYALDTVLPDLKSPTKVKVVAAMQGHVIAHADTREEAIAIAERAQETIHFVFE